MLRTECEEAILSKLIEIKDIAKTYDNNLEYLSLTIFEDSVTFNNNYWEGHNIKRLMYLIQIRSM